MARSLCGTIEQRWVAAVEPVGSHQTHLGPVSEENVVLKHSKSKGMRSLSSTIEDYFPGGERHNRMTIGKKTHTTWMHRYFPSTFSVQPLPVQTLVCDGFHGVKVAVGPVDPLSDNVKGDSCWSAQSGPDQLKAVATIHKGSLQLHLFTGEAHVCEEHVPAGNR